jgi:hypothetical protein
MPEKHAASDPIADRLLEILQREYERCGSSFLELQEEIKRANGDDRWIERRKLSTILETGDVGRLSFRELEALNTYLVSNKRAGVAAIFDVPELFQAIGERRQVTFFLAAKPHREHGTIDMAQGDVRAMAELISGIEGASAGVGVAFTIVDVLLRRTKGSERDLQKYLKRFSKEEWYHLLEIEDGPSLVCVGSPRACHAAEVMLSRMFGRKAFTEMDPFDLANAPPFYFQWDEPTQLPSSFAPGVEYARGQRGPVLSFEDKALRCRKGERGWHTYGVIVAQRRPRGQVWVVVAGLTAAGTEAAAKLAQRLPGEFPREAGKPSHILWQPIEVVYTDKGSRHLSNPEAGRHIIDQKVIGNPRYWSPGQ